MMSEFEKPWYKHIGSNQNRPISTDSYKSGYNSDAVFGQLYTSPGAPPVAPPAAAVASVTMTGPVNGTFDFDMPADRPDGDTYILVSIGRSFRFGPSGPPAGWTAVVDEEIDGTDTLEDAWMYVATKQGSSEPATYNWTVPGGSIVHYTCVLRITNADYAGIVVSTPNTNTGSTGNVNWPAIASAADGVVIRVGALFTNVYADPVNHTLLSTTPTYDFYKVYQVEPTPDPTTAALNVGPAGFNSTVSIFIPFG